MKWDWDFTRDLTLDDGPILHPLGDHDDTFNHLDRCQKWTVQLKAGDKWFDGVVIEGCEAWYATWILVEKYKAGEDGQDPLYDDARAVADPKDVAKWTKRPQDKPESIARPPSHMDLRDGRLELP